MQIIASGGVSSLEDVKKLSALGIHGAIVGKAYYTGALDLREAIEVAK
jgi:phosphoribosylformimino-5-aminoimidazole carboxamide ribotide isomerase